MWSVLQMVSLVGVMCVFAQCMSIPKKDCPRIVPIYLILQAFFAFGTWFGATYIGRVDEWYSGLVYPVSATPALVAAMWLSFYSLRNAKMHPLVYTEIALFIGMCVQAGYKYRSFPWGFKLIMFTAISFTVSGLFLLLSLDRLGSPQWNAIRFVLGTFLATEGLIHWVLPDHLRVEGEAAKATFGTAYPLYVAIAAFFIIGAWLYKTPVSP